MVARIDPEWWDRASLDGRRMRDVLAERNVGLIFRFLNGRGFSRASIAAMTGLSETRIRQIWQNRQQVTSYEVLERIADGLRIPRGHMGLAYTFEFDAAPAQFPVAAGESHSGDVSSFDAVRACLPAIRRALDSHDLPPDGPTRPLQQLERTVDDVVRMRLGSVYGDLAVLLPGLLPELHRAFDLGVGQRRLRVARLLVQTYRAADAIADKFGFFDLSARIIGLMNSAARDSGDEIMIATAAYVRAETFFATGDLATGRHMLEQAADRLMPEDTIDAAAVYGALHMRAAVMAARAGGNPSAAHDHIHEAVRIAREVPEGVYAGTAFGEASVRVHQVTLAVDVGDPDTALRAAEGWSPPPALPAERRSHFYVDLAKAQVSTCRASLALDSLERARRVAPEHVRAHPDVRQLVCGLLGTAPVRGQRLGAFATWMGVGLS